MHNVDCICDMHTHTGRHAGTQTFTETKRSVRSVEYGKNVYLALVDVVVVVCVCVCVCTSIGTAIAEQ